MKRNITYIFFILSVLSITGCKLTELRDCNLLLSRTTSEHVLRCKDRDDINVKGVAPWIVECAKEHEK